MSGMKAGVRVSNNEYEKENVADFALWKAYDREVDGPNKWEGKFNITTNDELQITNDKDGENHRNLKTKDYELKTVW